MKLKHHATFSLPLAMLSLVAIPYLGSPSTAEAAPISDPSSVVQPKDAKKAKPKSARNPAKTGPKARRHKRGAGKRGPGPKLCAALSCTAEQAAEVRTITLDTRKAKTAEREEVQALQTALARELAKPKPSAKEIARVRKGLDKHRQAKHKRDFDALLKLHAMLDASQRQELSRLIEARGVRRLFKGPGDARPNRRGAGRRGKVGKGAQK